jgi:Ni/Fe-hydrogenase 1 B-type cytochrome subunit
MAQKLTKTWSLGYIIEHWTRVIAIAVLTFTGFYIHWPFIAGGAECLLMSWMRFFHFVAAYVLILGLVVRVYMAFRSTFDADWKDFGIIRNIKNIPDILGYYLFIKGSHQDYRKYNPLQALAYLGVAVVIVVTAFTGGALYQGNMFGFIKAPDSFLWVNALLGGESATRIVHILSMWFFIVFVLIHVYMSIMATWVNKDRTLTSILTGYKLKKLGK